MSYNNDLKISVEVLITNIPKVLWSGIEFRFKLLQAELFFCNILAP